MNYIIIKKDTHMVIDTPVVQVKLSTSSQKVKRERSRNRKQPEMERRIKRYTRPGSDRYSY